MADNLAENLSFVADVVIDDADEPCAEAMEAALLLGRYSWNNAIQDNHTKIDFCIRQLRILQERNPRFWDQLIRKDERSIIDILMKRKLVFFPDDNRFAKECFFNLLGTVTVIEDNSEGTTHIQSRVY